MSRKFGAWLPFPASLTPPPSILGFHVKKEQRILNYFVAEGTVVVGTDPSRHFSSERSSKGRRRPSLSTFPTTIIKNPQLSAGSESEQTYVRTLISRKNLEVSQTLDIDGKVPKKQAPMRNIWKSKVVTDLTRKWQSPSKAILQLCWWCKVLCLFKVP